MLSKLFSDVNLYRIGIVGRAGAGKTTLATQSGRSILHVDSFFIKDSSFRKDLLETKLSKSFDSYVDACNMYNWWDWSKVESAIDSESTPLILEGALLGPESILDKLDLIIFINSSAEDRFSRLALRDGHKRSFKELLDRFQITEFSESLYYKNILLKYLDKIIVVNQNYEVENNATNSIFYNNLESIPYGVTIE